LSDEQHLDALPFMDKPHFRIRSLKYLGKGIFVTTRVSSIYFPN